MYKNLVAALEMTDQEQSLLAREMLKIETPTNLIDDEKIAIGNELLIFRGNPPKSQSELLGKAPLFCAYLFRESQKINLSIEEYIERKIPKQIDRHEIKFVTYKWQLSETEEDENTEEQTIEEAISTT